MAQWLLRIWIINLKASCQPVQVNFGLTRATSSTHIVEDSWFSSLFELWVEAVQCFTWCLTLDTICSFLFSLWDFFANLLPVWKDRFFERNRLSICGKENWLVLVILLSEQMVHAWICLALSLRSIGTSSPVYASPAAFTLLDVCLELEPDCSLEEKQEPFSHGHWLVRLEPAGEVALKPVVCSLETERESHEVGAYTCFTEVKKLLAILYQLVRYCQGV